MADQIPTFAEFSKGAAPGAGAAPAAIPKFSDYTPPAPPKEPTSWLDDIGDTVMQYLRKVNPVTQAQGVADMVQHPIDAAKSYGAATGELAKKAQDAFAAGNYVEGVRHSISYVLNGIPGLGAALDEAGTKSGTGDYKGAIADTAALATNLLAAKYGPKVLDAATEPGALPAAVAKVTTPVKNAAAAAHDVINKPGVQDALTGVGNLATGAYGMFEGGPFGIIGGGEKIIKGVTGISKGIAKRNAAAEEAAAAAKAAPPTVVGPNPYAGGSATASTIAPEALAPAPAVAVPPVQAPYFPPASTGPLPSAPVQVQAPVNPYASTNSPAALAAPPVASPAAAPALVPANPYFAGAGTAAPEGALPGSQPAAAPTSAPAPANLAAPGAPEGANTVVSDALKGKLERMSPEQRAKWEEGQTKIFENSDAKRAVFADHAQGKGISADDIKAMSLEDYAKLHGDIPTGKRNPDGSILIVKKTGKPQTYAVSKDLAASKASLEQFMRTREATAASAKTAAGLQAKGVTAKAAQSMTPEQLGVPDANSAADVRFQLQKLEAAPATKP